MHRPKHIIEYILGRSLLGFLGLLPLPIVSFIGAKIGAFIASLPINANSTARKNIAIAMPELNAQQIRNIQYESTKNFMQTILEMPALYKLNKSNFSKYINVVGFKYMIDNPDNFILSAHYGNWEVVLKLMGFNELPMAGIYRRANNPLIDNYITSIRTQTTGVMIPKGKSGARKLIKAIKNDMSVAFLNDQKMSDGIESNFFCQPVKSASAIADLALKYDRKICPAFCTRDGYGKFTFTFHEPVNISKQSASEAIQFCNDIIEKQIRQEPNLWLWQHKRFK